MATNEAPLDLLIYWQQKADVCGRNLSRVAHSLLGVPAASTASERVFSTAGRTMEEQRCQLSPDTVDGLLFVHVLKH